VGVLRTVSKQRLRQLLAAPEFNGMLQRLARTAATRPWHPLVSSDACHSGLARVAYFSMEFMLSEALPIYAGGLGNVAGDQLKAAAISRAGRRCRTAL